MPEHHHDIESQLRALGERLDAAVAPVRADTLMVAEMTLPRRRPARARTTRTVAVIAMLAAVVAGIVVYANRGTTGTPAARVTTSSSIAQRRAPARILTSLTIPADQPPIVAVFTNSAAWVSFWGPSTALPAVNFATEFALVIDSGDCSTFNGVDVVGYPDGTSWGFDDQTFGCHRGHDGLQLNRMAVAIARRHFGRTVTVGGPALSTPMRIDLANDSGYTRAALHGTTVMRMPCLFQHTNLTTLRQPISITLPGEPPAAIVPGNPLTRPDAVTLDGDGSTDPGNLGYAQGASTLLWGALNTEFDPHSPFVGLRSIKPGQIVTIAQRGSPSCVQHWRVTAVMGPALFQHSRTAGPPLQLVLTGFSPDATRSPEIYATAVPAN